MDHHSIIDHTIAFVKQELAHAEGGHDWWHAERVWRMAKRIAAEEGSVDMMVLEIGALLHDIADAKFHNGDEEIAPRKARVFLESLAADPHIIDHVEAIIRNISFKGGKVEQRFRSRELDMIQDADRLDALGALGIGRAFVYGGYKGRPMYDPAIKPNHAMSKEEYRKGMSPTINHFYEKILLLKDRMNTKTGRALAEKRHRYMEQYLEQFYKEWEGEV